MNNLLKQISEDDVQHNIKVCGNGLYFKELEQATNHAVASLIAHYMNDRFIKLCDDLINLKATSFKDKVQLTGSDRWAYCTKQKDFYELYIQTQNSQFVYLLDKNTTGSNIFVKELNIFIYSVREINSVAFATNNDTYITRYFKYGDNRDEGYCGTYSYLQNSIIDAFYNMNNIKEAFDVLYFARIYNEDED
jgi:hypothetical protein